MSEGIFYFAYGSNMNAARMRDRGVQFHERVFATLPDHALDFAIYYAREEREAGAAIIHPKEGFLVEGALYATDEAGLAILDGYEFRYYRDPVVVFRSNGAPVEAITYRPRPEEIHPGLLPRQEYLDHLLAGRDLLSEEYVRRLEGWAIYCEGGR